jgi:prolyl oligopeptidase
VASVAPPPPAPKPINDDDFAYLEDITGDTSIAFAKSPNAVSEGQLTKDTGFKPLQERLSSIYSSKDKIPRPYEEGGKIRNFWTDADHQRGIWRETTLAEYKKEAPAWTTILDIDALNKTESASYVYHGADCLYPKYTKCLISLSKGGGDAVIVREFDTVKKEFVKGGFELPEGKHNISWKDENTVYVGTDFGAGSLTKSGYARISKEWKRGTKIADAKQIYEAKDTDISGYCSREWGHNNKTRDFCGRALDMEKHEINLRDGDKLTLIEKPDDADFGINDDDVTMRIKADWAPAKADSKTYKAGSLLSMKLADFLKGSRVFQVLFTPDDHTSLAGWTETKTMLIVSTLHDVKKEITIFKRANDKAPWVGTPMKESVTSISVAPFNYYTSDDVWLWLEDFTVPSTLSLHSLTTGKREQLKKMPSFYNAENIESVQHFATSKDGTKVPYFEVGRKDRKGAGPTVIDAYGGFAISETPGYRASVGAAWLERGGTFVLANLRGGNEYGPTWHHAAMKHHRQNAYDDMAAVSDDLIKRGVATNKTLGIMGASNGGLLTSVMLEQHPEYYGAVISRVPLTDMKRYHKLLAGASWMGEYGDPDNDKDWEALSKYSPFQNIKKDASYPPVFYTTSTKDDRVHPGHARKMVAKLEASGYQPLYYENIEGGHGGAADIKQAAYVDALVYTFLASRLGLKTQ